MEARNQKPAVPKPLGRNGFKYRPRFGLVIECATEREQQKLYVKLTRLGYSCKVVCV